MNETNTNAWICWNKSAFFLWSYISWEIINVLKHSHKLLNQEKNMFDINILYKDF